MQLTPEACYRALRARDARFDGRFFTGVSSTRVFCRPICPAPPPHQRHCRFFPSAAAALDAGFRPCLRCLPETSPGTPAWNGSTAIVTRALRLIEAGGLDDTNVEAFAERLGVGARQLRRLFQRSLGASPASVAQTRRLLFAKKLLVETDLAVGDVAFASGFNSIRRFNEAVGKVWGRPPTALRRAAKRPAGAPASERVTLRLGYRPPFDWEALIAFLAERAVPGVECVEPELYARTFRLGEASGTVEVRPLAKANAIEATVRLDDIRRLPAVAARLRRLFDLAADPGAIADRLERDPRLRPLVARRPGLRIPGCWDPFEMTVRGILEQQVTVKGAATLTARLVDRFGEDSADEGFGKVFPDAETLAGADVATIGLTGARARAIAAAAEAALAGGAWLHEGIACDTARQALLALPGVGDWTSEYVSLRGIGDPDAFPAGDLGLQKRFGADKAELLAAAEAWRPWRAYAAIHLWTESLMEGRRP